MTRDRIVKVSHPSIYIFCEGDTEEKYFEKIRSIFRNPKLKIHTINLHRGGVVKNARKLNAKIKSTLGKEKINGISIRKKVFVVFDIDIFSESELDSLYGEVNKDVNLIPSNWIFEYWLLSHFEKYARPNGKEKYLIEIKKHFSPKNDKFTGKGDFDWLTIQGIDRAMGYATDVNNSHPPLIHMKNKDPYTEMPVLISDIKNCH